MANWDSNHEGISVIIRDCAESRCFNLTINNKMEFVLIDIITQTDIMFFTIGHIALTSDKPKKANVEAELTMSQKKYLALTLVSPICPQSTPLHSLCSY